MEMAALGYGAVAGLAVARVSPLRRHNGMSTAGPPNRIREHRLRRGWAVEELAERMDTTRQTVWKLETGRLQLKPKWLQALSRAFGLPQAAFLQDGYGYEASETAAANTLEVFGPPVAPGESGRPESDMDDSEFFADVQESLRQLYTEERVPIGARDLAKAAFDAFAEIVADHAGQEARDHALAQELRARRRFLREHRAELLTRAAPSRRIA